MNTPITDCCKNMLYGTVPADIARRLETDRAALMEALKTICIEIRDGHWSEDPRNLALLGIKGQAALAAARANFPTP